MSFAHRSRYLAIALAVFAVLAYSTVAFGGGGKSSERSLQSDSSAASFQDETDQASLQ